MLIKLAATVLSMAAVVLPLSFTASAEPNTNQEDLVRSYLQDNAQNDCRIMSNNPFDSNLLSSVITANSLIYGISGREAMGLMTIGAKAICPEVYERWENGPAPQQ